MAPNRFPWSVSARAGKPSWAARSTRRRRWAAPSSRLYSEWTWRWTKSARPPRASVTEPSGPGPGEASPANPALGATGHPDDGTDHGRDPAEDGDDDRHPDQPARRGDRAHPGRRHRRPRVDRRLDA